MKIKDVIKYFLLAFFLLFSLTSCSKEETVAPTGLDINEDNVLYWDDADNSKGYEIRFYNSDTDVETLKNVRKTNYSLDELEEGDYEISIKTISSNKKYKNSNYSEPLYYHKYYDSGCLYKLINNDLEYEVSKVGKANGTFTIENSYRGKDVTKVGDKAFKGSGKIEEVIIGDNITSIGDSAFYNCPKLKRIELPEGLISIGASCFQSCTALESIVIPKTVKKIANTSFAHCLVLSSVVINDGVEDIEFSAFTSCYSLQTISIPNSVLKIGEGAFSNCKGLSSVSFGEKLQSIDNDAFTNCTKLSDVKFKGNALETIGERAFEECSSISNIVLPSGLKKIGASAFYGCVNLDSIKIPSSCESVGMKAFNGTKIYSAFENEKIIYADNWAVGVNAKFSQELNEITNDTFKNGTIGIADGTFSGYNVLNSINLSGANSTIKYIGNYAFYNCNNLTKFIGGDSLVSLGNFAFFYCNIINVNLGNSLKRIGDYCFAYNKELDNNSLDEYGWIPETVESIGSYAFYETKLYNDTRKAGTIVYAGNWVVGIKNDKFDTISVTLEFEKDRVAGIADSVFMNSVIQNITGVVKCKYIGKWAFANCKDLTNISLNSNLTTIDDYAFYGCESLINVNLPYSLNSIGKYAFGNCTSLTEIDLESTKCKYINDKAFYNCYNLTNVYLDEGLESIGEKAFYNCINLSSIVIPNSVNDLGKKAFYNCTSLASVTFGSGIDTINDSAFYGCSSLKALTLPDNIKYINYNSFSNCKSLETINFGNGIESIGEYAFSDDENIIALNFPNSLKKISKYAFMNLKNVKVVVLNDSIDTIEQHAFYNCVNVTFYTPLSKIKENWNQRFNSSRRPIFYDVMFDDLGRATRVYISNDSFIRGNKIDNINVMDGFKCFTDDYGKEYNISDLSNIEGEVTLTIVYE